MTLSNLLKIAALLEIATGLVLMACPSCAALLLLNSDLTGAGLVVSRIAGFGLFALGIACWPNPQTKSAVLAMLAYGILITAYFVYLGFATLWVGWLLWPAVALHTILTLLISWKWSRTRI